MSNHDAIGFYECENSFDCSPREGLSGRAKFDEVQVAGSVSIINVCWLNSWGKLLSGLVIK